MLWPCTESTCPDLELNYGVFLVNQGMLISCPDRQKCYHYIQPGQPISMNDKTENEKGHIFPEVEGES